MQSHPPALTKLQSYQAVLLQLLRSERQLQRALREQRVLLQQLSDAAAQLFLVVKARAEGGEEECGGLTRFYSLHELLLLSAPRVQPLTAAAYDSCRPRRDEAERLLDKRLVRADGLAPWHHLLFGSLNRETQQLLLPRIQAWLRRLTDALPSSCQSHLTEEEDRRGSAGQPAAHAEGIPPSPLLPSRPGTKRARPPAADGNGEEEGPRGGGTAAALGESERKKRRVGAELLLVSPLLAIAAPGLRCRVICEALRRLLVFVRLALGLTEADTLPDAATDEECPAALDCVARISALLRQWVIDFDGGLFAAQLQSGERLPLVCLVRCQPQLKAALRLVLVDVQEVGDVLCEEVFFRQKRSHGRGGAAAGAAGSPPSSLRALCSLPASATASSLPRPPQATGRAGAEDAAEEDVWPSLSEIAELAQMAEVLAEALRQSICLN